MSEYRGITMGNLLRETASRFPDNEALICPDSGIRENYGEFLDKCVKVAKGFIAIGVGKGDHVSVWTTNVPEWIYMQFGLGMIGAVLVTVNTNYKSHEIEYILNQSDSTTLVLIEEYRDTNFFDVVNEILPEIATSLPGEVISKHLPHLKNVVYIGEREATPGMFGFKELITLGERVSDFELSVREDSVDFHDVVNMQYTSGTTGFPKGVMLTHYTIINNALMVGDVMGMTEKDRLLIQVPLFHCFGCVASSLNCVGHGSTMVIMESFDPLKTLQLIEKEKCTAVNGVPTMFIAILNHQNFDTFDMSSLRTGIMAGAPCPVEAMNRVINDMHCAEIVIAFGLTESGPVMTMTRRNDPIELRISTVGKLLNGVEGAVIDPETGDALPPNTQGEIITRSPCIMKGYYKMPKETKEAIDKDGWLHSGDLGTIDEKGYFKITGRIKDMIIRGGENIYPREIEEFLHTNSKVKDVYVMGVPDEKYGEQVLAVILLKAGELASDYEFIEFCKGKIARHKIPKYWEFRKDVPMTASGKVQKYKLIESFTKQTAA